MLLPPLHPSCRRLRPRAGVRRRFEGDADRPPLQRRGRAGLQRLGARLLSFPCLHAGVKVSGLSRPVELTDSPARNRNRRQGVAGGLVADSKGNSIGKLPASLTKQMQVMAVVIESMRYAYQNRGYN
ncbi:uncharacterized protein O3Q21_008531 [Podargus strigoides]